MSRPQKYVFDINTVIAGFIKHLDMEEEDATVVANMIHDAKIVDPLLWYKHIKTQLPHHIREITEDMFEACTAKRKIDQERFEQLRKEMRTVCSIVSILCVPDRTNPAKNSGSSAFSILIYPSIVSLAQELFPSLEIIYSVEQLLTLLEKTGDEKCWFMDKPVFVPSKNETLLRRFGFWTDKVDSDDESSVKHYDEDSVSISKTRLAKLLQIEEKYWELLASLSEKTAPSKYIRPTSDEYRTSRVKPYTGTRTEPRAYQRDEPRAYQRDEYRDEPRAYTREPRTESRTESRPERASRPERGWRSVDE